ncbi:MAG TPA: CheR family methyltransferase [Candidatus Rifleibacterium sp.]|nr:CheR family methyltransferase [Candidatus Rifleibacterium sp.]HPT47779.1 CheR family methyltransferase [Candidatus Rifleibacterium sp.]
MAAHKFSGKEIEDFCSFLSHEYGLSFPPARYSFVENRVEPLLADFSCRTLSDIILRARRDMKLRMDLLNNLTTNETWFFRHPEHFSILKNHVFPDLLQQKAKFKDNRLNIWSAGCSLGAELYSILFTLLEVLPDPEKFNLLLLGSDIASEAVKTAREGVYEGHQLRLINHTTLHRFFNELGRDRWQVKSEYRKYVEFEVINLLNSWPARTFDLIFCRNTMIYFDSENKARLTERFANVLHTNGYFLTSANEMIEHEKIPGIRRLFLENEIIYQKSGARKEYQVFNFVTPADLLRALNILKNHGFDYHLEKLNPEHELAPTRSIFISKQDSERATELFRLSSIKISSCETLNR